MVKSWSKRPHNSESFSRERMDPCRRAELKAKRVKAQAYDMQDQDSLLTTDWQHAIESCGFTILAFKRLEYVR